jgi:hypothetical protein
MTTAFEYYHFGGDSTADQYDGIDVRGEVIMLSRNIKIIADATENDWGCAIVNTDRVEFDKTVRIGRLVLDNVEIYGGGQEDTLKAAIRYESTTLAVDINKVVDTVVWGGNGKKLLIKASKNIEITDSVFLGA